MDQNKTVPAASEVLLETRADRVAVITLNRPSALNAIDRAMVRTLRAAIREVEADDRIDIVLVTGAGEKAFCVGVDLKERQRFSDEEAAVFRRCELFPMYHELEQRTKPAIAVVHGHALGGGFEIALACDLIVATAGSTFGFPETKWGLIPAAGGCRKLPKLIGMARAKELILTAATITAARAEQLGLINRMVAPESRLDEALTLAHSILSNVQLAVRGSKRCMDNAIGFEFDTAYDLEVANLCYAAKERKQGVAGFAARTSTK